MFSHLLYAPYFQRHHTWNSDKIRPEIPQETNWDSFMCVRFCGDDTRWKLRKG